MSEDKTNETPSVMDYEEHERTYALFISLSKWTGVACTVLLVYLFFFRT